jgi:hypothetical protein
MWKKAAEDEESDDESAYKFVRWAIAKLQAGGTSLL